MSEKLMQELADFSQAHEAAALEYDNAAEKLWSTLSKEQQLMLFYSVVKRIVKGELRDQGSYRYVLYNVFGFDSEAYAIGMDCGFLELHNSIYTQEEVDLKFNNLFRETE